ncbi:MAG: hypothetical protein NVSMB9_01210 [Isosphaeraceae bacterium]
MTKKMSGQNGKGELDNGRGSVRHAAFGLLVGLAGLVGCESNLPEPPPGTGGAGIPGLKGPAAPKTKAAGAFKAQPTPKGKSSDSATEASPAPTK